MEVQKARGLLFQLAIAIFFLAGCGDSTQQHAAPSALSPQSAPIPQVASAATRSYVNGNYIETDANSVPGQVYRLYRAILGRDPDAEGLGYHTGQIEVFGHTLAEVATNFMASPEFVATYGALGNGEFVTLLYQNVLSRTPDADGFKFWTDHLNAGLTRAEVVLGFSESDEFKTDNAHQGYNAKTLAAGLVFKSYPSSRVYLTDGSFVETDPEGNAAKVFRLYQAAFGRVAEPDGLGFQVGQIEVSGLNMFNLATNFMASDEFKRKYCNSGSCDALTNAQFVDNLYQNVLHRPGEESGRQFWLTAMTNGAPRVQVLASFAESDENKRNTLGAISAGIHFKPWPNPPNTPAIDPLAPLPPLGINETIAALGIGSEGQGGDGGGDGGASGGAGDGAPLRGATVTLVDSLGNTVSGKTDDNGQYLLRFNTSVFKAPFVVKTVNSSGIVLASAGDEQPAPGKVVRININPLTDKVTSDTLDASVQGTDKSFTGAAVDSGRLAAAKSNLAQSIGSALVAAGVSNAETLDVVRSTYEQKGGGVDGVIESLIRTRDPVTGATVLRVKLASPDDASAIVTPSTPLQPAQVLTPDSPALSFAKLKAWMDFMNACFQGSGANYASTTTLGACTPLQLAPAISANFKDGGRDIWLAFEQAYSDVSGAFLAGTQLRNPNVLFVSSYSGGGEFDMTVVEFTLRMPQSELPPGDDPAFTANQPQEYPIRLVFKRDDTTPGLAAQNWILHGDQRDYFWWVEPTYVSHQQVNPAQDLNSSGKDPSYISTRLDIYFIGAKYNTRADNFSQANDVYAVRVTGPGLPLPGLVLARQSNGTLDLAIDNKGGFVPAPGSTAATSLASFVLSQHATTTHEPIDAALWGGFFGNHAASAAFADTPTSVDFSVLQPLGVYTAEIYRSTSPSPVIEKFRMVPGVLSPPTASLLPLPDLSPNLALVTPTHPSQNSVTLNWNRTPGAMLVNTAQLMEFNSRNTVTNSPVSTGLYSAQVDYYPLRRSLTSLTLQRADLASLPAQTATVGRMVKFYGRMDGASIRQEYLWTPSDVMDATQGVMGPQCLMRLRDASARIEFETIKFTVASASTCSSASCVDSTLQQFRSLGISAGVNSFSQANPGIYSNTPACVSYRADIFAQFRMANRGPLEAQCVAAFLGTPYAYYGNNSQNWCTGDGYLIPATTK